MPTVAQFATVAGQATKDGQQIRINNADIPVLVTDGDKIGNFLLRKKDETNDEALDEFKAALTTEYGPDIADDAFTAAGLDIKEGTHGALTIHRVKDALMVAADLQYKKDYSQRNDDAGDWDLTSTPSTLDPTTNPGLRYSSTDKGGMRVHGWHLEQHTGGPQELDDLVQAERDLLPDHLTDAQKNVQARLNLLDAMLTEADGHLANAPEGESQASANVFMAPEWLFTNMVANQNGELESGGTLTEGEMKAITKGLASLSEKHPNMVIMPGTILWSKPAQGLITGKGMPQNADLVFNTMPVMSGGKLVHHVYKLTDGGDGLLASKGMGGDAYESPKPSNNFGARMQIFPSDAQMPESLQKDESLKAQIKGVRTGPGREWEVDLMKEDAEAPSVKMPNNFFEVEGRTFAVEICADHSIGNVARRFYESDESNDIPLITNLKNSGGVDGQFVIAAGSSMSPKKSLAKSEGIMAGIDLNVGIMQVQSIFHKTEYNGQTGLVEPVPKSKDMTSFTTANFGPAPDQEDEDVSQDVDVDLVNDDDSAISVDDDDDQVVNVKTSSSVRSELRDSNSSMVKNKKGTGSSVRDSVSIESSEEGTEKLGKQTSVKRKN